MNKKLILIGIIVGALVISAFSWVVMTSFNGGNQVHAAMIYGPPGR
jgi:hypothetical protein